jgi:hypothetical protein
MSRLFQFRAADVNPSALQLPERFGLPVALKSGYERIGQTLPDFAVKALHDLRPCLSAPAFRP